MAFSPDGRLFYTERCTGNIRVVANPTSNHPVLVPEPVYTVGPVSCFFERGLLGLALDPRFSENGYLYVYYSHKGTDPSKDPYRHRLMRITVKDNQGDAPMALIDNLPIGSQQESGHGNHNGGGLIFGPDGDLYLSMGELADPRNSQDLDSFAGKILRIRPDGTAPKDNPFYDPGHPNGPRSYVYALGLRNTFGFAFQPGTHTIWGPENGPSIRDEVNRIEAGKNYGWDTRETSGIRKIPGYADPLIVYFDTIAPTGTIFYTGSRYPEYRNNLFFADWNDGRIHRIVLGGGDTSPIADRDDRFYDHSEGIVDLSVGPDGDIYFSAPDGIYRLVPR
jgi:glucose/arabinose dehydrogenase